MQAQVAAVGASVGFALAAIVAARRCGLALKARGVWMAALVIAPITCVAVWLRHPAVAAGTIAICAGCVSAQTDLECGLIFDTVTVGALGALLLRAAETGTLPAAFFGCVVTATLLAVLWAASGGRGVGLGDIKFAAVMGAAFGCAWGAAALGAAFVSGGAAAAILLFSRRVDRRSALPFAPFLAIGCAFSAAMGGSLS